MFLTTQNDATVHYCKYHVILRARLSLRAFGAAFGLQASIRGPQPSGVGFSVLSFGCKLTISWPSPHLPCVAGRSGPLTGQLKSGWEAVEQLGAIRQQA